MWVQSVALLVKLGVVGCLEVVNGIRRPLLVIDEYVDVTVETGSSW